MPGGAPSVLSPEIVIPSAPRPGSLQSFQRNTVLWPESLPGRLLLRHGLSPDSPVMLLNAYDRIQRCGKTLCLCTRSLTTGMMKNAYVFGYGSLVNAATHNYGALNPASLNGWRRVWRHVEGRSVAFLTIVRAPGTVINGVVAPVPDTDWEALDQRERSYVLETETPVAHTLNPNTDVRFYHAPEHLHRPHSGQHPILLSYLDVVVQGYMQLGGETAVQDFFETTDGWDAPIADDRSAPRYPRHQNLSADERKLTDAWLATLRCRLTPMVE